VKIGPGGVNDASTRAPGALGRAHPRRRCTAVGAVVEGRNPVLDLLYAGVVIAVFAVLLLAVRGLDRL
jgi:hypothetical protein